MPWTTPRTWVSLEVVTASILNRELRDNLAYLYLHYLMPVGGIVWFNSSACPTGYSEVTAARGRVIVAQATGPGTPIGGSLGNLGTISTSVIGDHTHDMASYSVGGGASHSHNFPFSGSPGDGGDNSTAATGSSPTFFAGMVSTVGGHNHGFSGTTASAGSGSADVTTPYIQYIVCKKD